MGQNTKSYELITFAAFLVGLPGFDKDEQDQNL